MPCNNNSPLIYFPLTWSNCVEPTLHFLFHTCNHNNNIRLKLVRSRTHGVWGTCSATNGWWWNKQRGWLMICIVYVASENMVPWTWKIHALVTWVIWASNHILSTSLSSFFFYSHYFLAKVSQLPSPPMSLSCLTWMGVTFFFSFFFFGMISSTTICKYPNGWWWIFFLSFVYLLVNSSFNALLDVA